MGKKSKLTEEIVDKVLFLDCTKDENIRRLKKSLIKLPFIKEKKDLETDGLERLIKKIELKYPIHLSYVMRGVVDGVDLYTVMIRTDVKMGGKHLKTIYGVTINEVFAKSLFYMFYYIEKNRKSKRKK